MSPELITAVSERIKMGRSQADIVTELVQAGYSEELATQAYMEAQVEVAGPAHDEVIFYDLPDNTDTVADSAVAQKTPGQSPTASYAVDPNTSLIGLGRLFLGANSLIFNQWQIFLYSLGLMVVIFVVSFVLPGFIYMQVNPMLVVFILLPLSFFLFLVLSMVVYTATTRALLLRRQHESYTSHLLYVVKNFLPLVWILFLSSLIVGLGFVLLIIPGIIAQFLLLFAVPVFLLGQARGFSAIRRSAELVWGRFWGVVGRLLMSYLVAVVLMMVVGGVFSTASIVNPLTDPFSMMLPGLLNGTLTLYVSFWSVCVLILLFESLVSLPHPRNLFSNK